jgi:hypothetical protein
MALLLAITLSGCGADPEIQSLKQQVIQLEEQNHELQQRMDTNIAKAIANDEYYEQQASLARGCTWLLPLCPASVTKVGQEALDAGYAGINSWYFVLAIFAKLTTLALTAGSLICIPLLVWIKRGRPAAEEIVATRNWLDNAQTNAEYWGQQAESRRQEVNELKDKIALLSNTIEQQQLELLALNEAESKTRHQLKIQQTAIAALNSI